MALARLLTAALLFSSLPAFAQDQPTADRQASIKTDRYRFDGAATPFEPWKIFQAPPANLSSDSKHRIQVDRYHFDQGNIDFRTNHSWIVAKPDTLITSLDGDPGADTTCFSIRSYVVRAILRIRTRRILQVIQPASAPAAIA
jgi:hypothetical protein